MLQNLETLARDAKSWPFEQARNLLDHVLNAANGPDAMRAARLFARADLNPAQLGDVDAAMLAVFTTAIAFTVHRNWSDRATLNLFMMDFTIIGGLLAIAVHGAGPLSLDAWLG